jgi:hypothetical protein
MVAVLALVPVSAIRPSGVNTVTLLKLAAGTCQHRITISGLPGGGAGAPVAGTAGRTGCTPGGG